MPDQTRTGWHCRLEYSQALGRGGTLCAHGDALALLVPEGGWQISRAENIPDEQFTMVVEVDADAVYVWVVCDENVRCTRYEIKGVRAVSRLRVQYHQAAVWPPIVAVCLARRRGTGGRDSSRDETSLQSQSSPDAWCPLRVLQANIAERALKACSRTF